MMKLTGKMLMKHVMILVWTLVALGFQAASSAAELNKQGLIAWQPFENKEFKVGQKRSKHISYSVRGDHQTVAGKKGNGLLLNKKSELKINKVKANTEQGTLVMRIKPQWDNGAAGKCMPFSAFKFFDIKRTMSGGAAKLQIRFRDDEGEFYQKHNIDSPIEEHKWYQLVLTWDRNKGIRMLVDGSEVIADSSKMFAADDSGFRKAYVSTRDLPMIVDEVYLYDRVLKDDELAGFAE